MTLYEAVQMVRKAWKRVPGNLIRSAWERCQVLPCKAANEDVLESGTTESMSIYGELESALSTLREHPHGPGEEVLSADECVRAAEELLEEAFAERSASEIAKEKEIEQEEEELDEDEDCNGQPHEAFSLTSNCVPSEISYHAAMVVDWLERHVEDYGEATRAKAEEVKALIDKRVVTSHLHQASIKSFFNSS